TMKYVAANLGQQAARRMQMARITAIEMSAVGRSGKISATIIPVIAISARPTNGCRGALSNFTYRLLSYLAVSGQAANVSRCRNLGGGVEADVPRFTARVSSGCDCKVETVYREARAQMFR